MANRHEITRPPLGEPHNDSSSSHQATNYNINTSLSTSNIASDLTTHSPRPVQSPSSPQRGTRSTASLTPPSDSKRPRLRPARDVLNRLRSDESLRIEDWIVGYTDRFTGIVTRPVADWIGESTDEEWIPEHRIRFFARWDDVGGEKFTIMWDRRAMIDRIWGSGLGGV